MNPYCKRAECPGGPLHAHDIDDVERKTHPELRCEILVFMPGIETWRMDHGVVDDRGRKIGGQIRMRKVGTQIGVRIQATRDGVTFGSSRLEEWADTLEKAYAMAERKLRRQRDQYQRKYPGDPNAEPQLTDAERDALASRYSRPIKIF